MAQTIKQTEAIPASYPTLTTQDIVKPIGNDAEWIWQRIESYTAHRFTERQVVWIVEGEGDWTPPLTPATIDTVEKWDSGAWGAHTAEESPYGGLTFFDTGPFRITATVGGGAVPADVMKAAARLANYTMNRVDENEGPMVWASNLSRKIADPDNTGFGITDFTRPSNWLADAMRKSGAADLLRNYRRAT